MSSTERENDRVTSAKPQRSTSPKAESMQQQQQRPAKPEYYSRDNYEKQREASAKSNVRPIDFNKDEYIPDDMSEYPDEEIDDGNGQQPQMAPLQKQNPAPLNQQHHHRHMATNPKMAKDHESIASIPYSQPQPQSQLDRSTPDVYKTKFHRLAPASNANTRPTDEQRAPNTEPEERDVYTILPKDTISTVHEPTGFVAKPVVYEPPMHEFDIDLPKNARPYVRIMKRPFLPSRGGSPYLPRGLKV